MTEHPDCGAPEGAPDDSIRITLRVDRAIFSALPPGRTNTETARSALIRAATEGTRMADAERRLGELCATVEALDGALVETRQNSVAALEEARALHATIAAALETVCTRIHLLACEVAILRGESAGLLHGLGERIDLTSEAAKGAMTGARMQSERVAEEGLEAALTMVQRLSRGAVVERRGDLPAPRNGSSGRRQGSVDAREQAG
ncbi:MAG: hypothetical protein AAF968_13750 [Pseudomonadota bacterium]